MADKKYKLNFEMSDGSIQSIEFTVPQGAKGENGKSAYDYAKTGGYTGTETEFYESLAKITDVLQQATVYSITTNLTGVTGPSSNPTTIPDNETVELTFTANSGYTLPETVLVSGATYNWDKSTGKLTLRNPTGNVIITIIAEKITYHIATYLTGVTGASSNQTTISYGGSNSLSFTANDGYELPDVVTVVGASYDWNLETGMLFLYDPTGNVSVFITGIASDSYITFLGDDGDFNVTANNVEWDGTIEYSTDKSTWSVWNGSAISSSDSKLYMRGSRNTTFCTSNGMRLVLSANAGCHGNLNTLLEYRNPPSKLTAKNCFRSMFENCVHLTRAPELPATTLYPGCYQQMFSGCTNLTRAPELPAMDLSPYCYYKMFYGCESLTQAPELPATTLKNFCYQAMFSGCTSLTQPPELPATTATVFCYYEMFSGCTSLTQPPELPATTLASQCYYGMFSGCSNLTQPPKLPATTLGTSCYQAMFQDCTNLTQPPELPATTLIDGCYRYMFYNCTEIKLSDTQGDGYQTAYRIPTSGTGTTASDALGYMFSLTGGTFTGTPSINTTYYGAWSDS